MTDEEWESLPLRYPSQRPGWLGLYQSWECGRCGRDVDAADPHRCVSD